MRRFWVEQDIQLNVAFQVSGDEFKHIFVVCKQDVSSSFEILTGGVEIFLCKVNKVEKKTAELVAIEKRLLPALPEPGIHLALCYPKPQIFERVLEKSVELGVKEISPIISEYSFFKSPKKILEKNNRALKIVKQAQRQTGRGVPMIINDPITLDEFLSLETEFKSKKTKKYFLNESEGSEFDALKFSFSQNIKSLLLLVGPEGGFSQSEIEKIKSSAYSSVSLGEQILRVETACVAGISILKFSWKLWE